ncbi:chromophore lyase CpcT/CpeT [Lusitaniella coriacea LEGE 07157]|uniref:Chromophore lyase CpcT/CpeT n=1 Tax=Lusitaniella coriacea LEGE 07157 TaxID=945747 RepID=A0A8J7ALV9_9CYAN|nr:chromophore lyase CpcT/CpeT [Lusitaniella coriacea]MBE9114273.1 chromophore lyase CpcT/CpeT [Lusitaniella coriacea LEGE 07157]
MNIVDELPLPPNFSLITAIAVLGIATPLQANPIKPEVEIVATHLVGIMETSAQAAANLDAPSVRMTTCRVRIAARDPARNLHSAAPVFLYQEQALTERLQRPYRQRFLQLAPSATENSVESKAFKPIDPERWIGLCDRAENQRILQPSDLIEAGCSVFLVPVNQIYVGNTQAGGCATNVRGAVRITNTIFLHSAGMDTWDRGFDAQGNQVWGAKDQSYQFRWIE